MESNILNILPEELWIKIILELPCHTISNICKIKQFDELCKKHDLFNKKKFKGFPRKQGYCGTYNIGNLIKLNLEQFNNLLIESKDYLEGLSPFHDLLECLIDTLDMVRGDLLYFDHKDTDHFYIFNGCNVRLLDYELDESGVLPSEFTIINNGVPSDYWYASDKNIGIPMNEYVWFNHSTVRDQLINNVKFDKKDNMIFTKFVFDNVEYAIIFLGKDALYNAYNLVIDEKRLLKFKEILSIQNQNLLLEYLDDIEIKDMFEDKIPDKLFYLMEFRYN